MKLQFLTWNKAYGNQGCVSNRMKLRLETDDDVLFARVTNAIKRALNEPPPEKGEAAPAIGFGLQRED